MRTKHATQILLDGGVWICWWGGLSFLGMGGGGQVLQGGGGVQGAVLDNPEKECAFFLVMGFSIWNNKKDMGELKMYC
jgi:hypothetical protein